MRLSTRIKLALLVWLTAEALAFSLVAHWLGLPRTILLGVITSLLGLTLLRRAGTSALMKLRAGLDGRPDGPTFSERGAGHFLDETLATVGALALLLPGFLSDTVGLVLAVPALRGGAARWVQRGGLAGIAGRPPSQRGPSTIDLAPEEWRRSEAAKRPANDVDTSSRLSGASEARARNL